MVPAPQDTPRQFECTRLITAKQVKDVIRRIPGFAEGVSGVEAVASGWTRRSARGEE